MPSAPWRSWRRPRPRCPTTPTPPRRSPGSVSATAGGGSDMAVALLPNELTQQLLPGGRNHPHRRARDGVATDDGWTVIMRSCPFSACGPSPAEPSSVGWPQVLVASAT